MLIAVAGEVQDDGGSRCPARHGHLLGGAPVLPAGDPALLAKQYSLDQDAVPPEYRPVQQWD